MLRLGLGLGTKAMGSDSPASNPLDNAALLTFFSAGADGDITTPDGSVSEWNATHGTGRLVPGVAPSHVAASDIITFDGTQYLRPPAPILLNRTRLPDGGTGSLNNTGFTNTGMVRNGDGTFWIANFGQPGGGATADVPGGPSLCLVSADLGTLIRQIDLQSLDATAADPQGLGLEAATGYLYVTSKTNGILVIDPATDTLVRTVNLTFTPNALTFDNDGDRLLVGYAGTEATPDRLSFVNKTTGAILSSIDTAIPNLDHCFMDASEQDLIYIASGGNGVDAGVLSRWSVPQSKITDNWSFAGCHAPEAIWIEGSTLWFCSDEGFHSGVAGSDNKNSVLTYQMPWLETGNTYTVIARANLAPAITGNNLIFTIGDGNTSLDLGGTTMLLRHDSARLYCNGPLSGTTDRDLLIWSSGLGFDPYTATTYRFEIVPGSGATLFVDGTEISTIAFSSFTAPHPRLSPGAGASYARLDAALSGILLTGDLAGAAVIAGTSAENASLIAAVEAAL